MLVYDNFHPALDRLINHVLAKLEVISSFSRWIQKQQLLHRLGGDYVIPGADVIRVSFVLIDEFAKNVRKVRLFVQPFDDTFLTFRRHFS